MVYKKIVSINVTEEVRDALLEIKFHNRKKYKSIDDILRYYLGMKK